MKKIVVAVIAVMSIGLSQVNAQGFLSKFSGGLKLEANTSNFILSNMPGVKSTLNAGGAFGGFVKFDISEHFAIQEDILFSYKSSKLEQNGVKGDFQYWGVEVPFYAMGQWKMNTGRFYLGAGPYVGYGFSAKNKVGDTEIDLFEKNDNTDKAFLNPFNVGAAAIVGYEFKNKIQLNASYKIGFTNSLDAGKNDATMLPQTISVGIGYRF